ncbi:IQ motif and SEC7 domain-containing protein 1-like isoform X3 [Lineus longissimus]|uniref:IQ motif and SEC7 domain-containing protein 1-like isoform X3 n=1 Tax=Lineus longissimus TaxID=88925 RepID=UPI00315D7E2C
MSDNSVICPEKGHTPSQDLLETLKAKDSLIQVQSERIVSLEQQVEQLKLERDSLIAKLHLNSKKHTGKLQNGSELTALPPGAEKSHLERSTSLSTYPKEHSKLSRTSRQKTVIGQTQLHRQHSCLHPEEDQRVKQSRSCNTYELSQDLQDKQLEMLERKYGGHFRTRRAATTIQQAFRKYSMNKNFEKLRHAKAEKRISRRFSEYNRSASMYDEMEEELDNEGTLKANMGKGHSLSPKQLGRAHTVALDRNYNASGDYDDSDVCEGGEPSKRLERSGRVDIDDNKTMDQLPLSETNNNRNSYPELNDSSPGESSRGSPISTEDLHSVNFENLLESRETDILNDSFHSDGSQDSGTGAHRGGNQSQRSIPKRGKRGPPPPPPPRSDSYKNSILMQKSQSQLQREEPLYDNLHGHGHSESAPIINSEVQIKVDCASPTDDQMFDQNSKLYANQEVKFRNRKCISDSALGGSGKTPDASPVWKRKSAPAPTNSTSNYSLKSDTKRMSNISENSEPESVSEEQMRYSTSSQSGSDTASIGSNSLGSDFSGYQRSMESIGYQRSARVSMESPHMLLPPRISDKQRKREYRVGLNLFNKKPEKGIFFLVQRCFIEDSPPAVAKFLITRKGLSKQMIGEYLGNLQLAFNMEVLDYFVDEIDLSGLQVDVALRKFQTYFRMPGEAQKIERLMEAFAHRYCICNPDQINKFSTSDTVFLLAFAIIMLNTDLHNSSIKNEKKMKPNDFIKNLRGIDDSSDIDPDLLFGIYERIKLQEFKAGVDHVMQVMKVEKSVVGKRPILALPHRRLVCYCRLYEVNDPSKKEKLGLHQREIFLFNDLLLVTKVFSKKKGFITYSYRQHFMLCGMQVYLFDTSHYQFGVRLTNHIDGKVLITFNARNEHDRAKFVDDLKECILEMNEMEALRIEEELQKQKHTQKQLELNRISSDSGVVDVDLLRPLDSSCNHLSATECGMKKSALSNSLIDLSDSGTLKPQRRGSGGSLDSGMCMLQSSTTSVRTAASQDEAPEPKRPQQTSWETSTPIQVSGGHHKKHKQRSKGHVRVLDSHGHASDI